MPYLVARFILIAGMAGCLMPLRASRAVGSHRQSLLTGPTLILLVQHAGSYLGTLGFSTLVGFAESHMAAGEALCSTAGG